LATEIMADVLLKGVGLAALSLAGRASPAAGSRVGYAHRRRTHAGIGGQSPPDVRPPGTATGQLRAWQLPARSPYRPSTTEGPPHSILMFMSADKAGLLGFRPRSLLLPGGRPGARPPPNPHTHRSNSPPTCRGGKGTDVPGSGFPPIGESSTISPLRRRSRRALSAEEGREKVEGTTAPVGLDRPDACGFLPRTSR